MGILENSLQDWKDFIDKTKERADCHSTKGLYWDALIVILNMLVMIFATSTAMLTLLPVSKYIATGAGALTTAASIINAVIHPTAKVRVQETSCKNYKVLMIRMLRCDSVDCYNELWDKYYEEIATKPKEESLDSESDVEAMTKTETEMGIKMGHEAIKY